jgi:preprotein translocase subunit SecG
MYAFLLVVHLFICIALVCAVLIQSGKGGGLAGGAFGGSAQTVFGGRGATDFITRATMILGGAFFVTSLFLAFLSMGGGRAPRSLFQTEQGRATQGAPPAAPGQLPPAQAPGATPAAPANPTPQQPANPAPPGGSGP